MVCSPETDSWAELDADAHSGGKQTNGSSSGPRVFFLGRSSSSNSASIFWSSSCSSARVALGALRFGVAFYEMVSSGPSRTTPQRHTLSGPMSLSKPSVAARRGRSMGGIGGGPCFLPGLTFLAVGTDVGGGEARSSALRFGAMLRRLRG